MKPPPIARPYDPTKEGRLFATLRREILAAQLKITLDEQMGRQASPKVKRLAKMKLPPIRPAADVIPKQNLRERPAPRRRRRPS
jgi:hypothetical protein